MGDMWFYEAIYIQMQDGQAYNIHSKEEYT